MLKFSILRRYLIIWLISSVIAIIISFFKDMLNQQLKLIGSTYYTPYYKWSDFWIFFAVILSIVCIAYFIVILLFSKQFKSLASKEILAIILSFFLVPLLIPYNSLPQYLHNILNFSLLREYLFEIMEIGIAGSLIPIIDLILNRMKQKEK